MQRDSKIDWNKTEAEKSSIQGQEREKLRLMFNFVF